MNTEALISEIKDACTKLSYRLLKTHPWRIADFALMGCMIECSALTTDPESENLHNIKINASNRKWTTRFVSSLIKSSGRLV